MIDRERLAQLQKIQAVRTALFVLGVLLMHK